MAQRARTTDNAYIYGNTVRSGTVRSGQDQPLRRSRSERRYGEESYTRPAGEMQSRTRTLHRATVSETVRRNQEKALQMDLPYVMMLTIAAFCVLYICVNYLHVQSSITARIRNIEYLEQQIEQVKAENDALQTNINTNIDLDHIYDVATKELGMVYANRSQVLLYDRTESEYVRQYEDIPEH